MGRENAIRHGASAVRKKKKLRVTDTMRVLQLVQLLLVPELSFSTWSSSAEFWKKKEKSGGGGGGRSEWSYAYTVGVLVLILFCQLATIAFRFFRTKAARPPPPAATPSSVPVSHLQFSGTISDLDLKCLIDGVNEKLHDGEKWENVIDRSNDLISYSAKCCKPKDGPLKYVSVTIFENVSSELLRDFYMDSDYRKNWDKTLIEHKQLQVDETTGIEVGRTIKKFLLLTPREYVISWRLWQGKDGTLYCFSKECEHPLAPRQRKYVRVEFFRSGWRIRKVPGRQACEIKMVHQEDAGLNTAMARLAFAKGIWNYVCKMDNALRKYSTIGHLPLASSVNAMTFIQKVPPGLDITDNTSMIGGAYPETSAESTVAREHDRRNVSRRPSSELVTNGLLLVGGIICLSRGHSKVGANIAMAYILSKLTKLRRPSGQSSQASVL